MRLKDCVAEFSGGQPRIYRDCQEQDQGNSMTGSKMKGRCVLVGAEEGDERKSGNGMSKVGG